MLPGQWGLLIIGIVSAAVLGIMGLCSFSAFEKEKRQKQKEERAKRRELWHQSMMATEEDVLPTEQPDFAEQEISEPVVFVEEKSVADTSEKPQNTRNDFDFKF